MTQYSGVSSCRVVRPVEMLSRNLLATLSKTPQGVTPCPRALSPQWVVLGEFVDAVSSFMEEKRDAARIRAASLPIWPKD